MDLTAAEDSVNKTAGNLLSWSLVRSILIHGKEQDLSSNFGSMFVIYMLKK